MRSYFSGFSLTIFTCILGISIIPGYTQELKLVPPLGHTEEVNDVLITKDQKYVFSCGNDNSIILWDIATGKEVKRFMGHLGRVSTLQLSSDEKMLVSKSLFRPQGGIFASDRLDTKLWDVSSGNELKKIFSDQKNFKTVCFSNDGRFILTGYSDGTISKWNYNTQNKTITYQLDTVDIQEIKISPNNNYALITSGNWDMKLTLFNLKEGKVEEIFKINGLSSTAMFQEGEKYVLYENDLFDLHLWDILTKSNPKIDDESFYNDKTRLSPDGKYILYNRNGVISFYERTSGTVIHTLGSSINKYEFHQFLPDGHHIFVSTSENTLEVWDINNFKRTHTFPGHNNVINAIDVSTDGKLIVTGSWDKTVRIWDLSESRSKNRSKVLQGYVRSIAAFSLSENGRKLLAGSPEESSMIWEISENNEVEKYNTGYSPNISFMPGSEYVLSEYGDQNFQMWHVKSKKIVRRFKGKSFENYFARTETMDISDNGKYVAAGINYTDINTVDTSFNMINVFDVNTGELIQEFINEGKPVSSLCFSPDMKYLLSGHGEWYSEGSINVWDIKSGTIVRRSDNVQKEHVRMLKFFPDGKRLVSGGRFNIDVWDFVAGKKIYSIDRTTRSSFLNTSGFEKTVDISIDNRWLLYAENGDNTIMIADANTGKILRHFGKHSHDIVFVHFLDNSQHVISASQDGTIKLWDVNNGKELATLMIVGDSDWVVVAPDGLFDASPGAMKLMHFVYGEEIIELEQLKDRYYEPGLLQKILGINPEPIRESRGFGDFELCPAITLVHPDKNNGKLGIHLENRGGGIGSVKIWINGKEVTSDARASGQSGNIPNLVFDYPVIGHPYLKTGELNQIEVKVYNGEHYILSQGKKVFYYVEGNKISPTMYGIVIGTSNYSGEQLDLRYAAKDAKEFASALKIVGQQLLGENNVEIIELTTENKNISQWPTKENIRGAFNDIGKKSSPYDILILYIAGHGMNFGGAEGDFYYLTAEASGGNLQDPVVRDQVAISSEEFTELVKKVPALKQVMIIDACHAGKFAENLLAKRESRSASEIRALEKLMDRTGMFILAGSAADAVSYETSVYGQGLLTYSLLFGMKGAALRDNQFVDVMSLFQFAADRVPDLAKNIGGIQKPEIRVPYGGESFDIGMVTESIQKRIVLPSPKPIFIRSSFQNEATFNDDLRLSDIINGQLSDMQLENSQQPLVFIDVSRFIEGYSIKGRYTVENGSIRASVRVFRGDEKLSDFVVNNSNTEQLSRQIIQKALMSVHIDKN